MPLTQITPQASPVQSFVRPSQPSLPQGPSKLQELAQALSTFNPALTQFLDHHVDRVSQKQVDEATSKRTQTALNYKDAVAKGIISPHENPFFIQAWQEQDGKVAADKYNADLQTGLVVGDFASSLDPNQTEPLLNTFRSNWMKQAGVDATNKDFMSGFAKQATAYEANVRAHQNAAVGQRILASAQEGLYKSTQGEFDDGLSRGLPASEIADGIQRVKDKMVLGGMPPQQANKIILDAAIAKAQETQSMHPFDILDTLKTGSGYLGRTADAMQAKEVMQNRINASIAARDSHSHELKVWDDADTDQRVTADIFSTIFQNKLAGVATSPDSLASKILELAKVNPTRAEAMKQLAVESGKPDVLYDNPSISSQLVVDLYEGRLTNSQVIAAHSSKGLTLETTSKLLGELYAHNRNATSDAQAAADRAHGLYREDIADERYAATQQRLEEKDPDAARGLVQGAAGIKRQFGADEMGINKLDPQANDRMNDALAVYYRTTDQWLKANPKSSTEERLNKFNEIRKTVSELFPAPTVDTATDNIGKPAISHDALPTIPTKQGPIGQLTNPVKPPSSSQRLYGSSQEWTAAFQEFSKDPVGSPLGLKLQQMHFASAADMQAFVEHQQALYATDLYK